MSSFFDANIPHFFNFLTAPTDFRHPDALRQRWTKTSWQTGTPACVTALKTPTLVRIKAVIYMYIFLLLLSFCFPLALSGVCFFFNFPGCYGFWCCPCLACTVSSRFGENTCLPLCDMFSLAITSAFEIPLLIASPALLSLRSSIRHKHKIKVWCMHACKKKKIIILRKGFHIKIYRWLQVWNPTHFFFLQSSSKGSLCQDIAVSCFCVWCGWCQLHRELRYLRKNPTVINVVNIQPAPQIQAAPVMMMPAYPMPVRQPAALNCITSVWVQAFHCFFGFQIKKIALISLSSNYIKSFFSHFLSGIVKKMSD